MTNEELAINIKAGQKELIGELWGQVEKLIKKIAYKYLPADGSNNLYELDDLMQTSYFGFLKAVNDFKSEAGYNFTTYLTLHIKNAICELIGLRGHSTKEIKAVSLDVPFGEDESLTLADTIIDDSITDFAEVAAENDFCHIVRNAVNNLPDNQRDIIALHYFNEIPYNKICEITGEKLREVRNIEKKAFQKLRINKGILGLTEEERAKAEAHIDSMTDFYKKMGVEAFRTVGISSVEIICFEREQLRDKLIKR